MFIYRQRGRNVWNARMWDAAAKRMRSVSLGVADRDKAVAIANTMAMAKSATVPGERLHRILDELLGSPDKGARTGGVRLDALWDRYAATPGIKLAKYTSMFRRHGVKRFVKWCAGQHPDLSHVAQVSRQVAAEYLDFLKSEGKTGKTCNNARGDLGAVWQELLIRENLPENVWRITKAFRKDDSVHGRDFSPAEIVAIMEAARAKGRQWPEICVAGLYTGLRYGDLMNQRWESVRGGCIFHRPSKTDRHQVEVAVPIHPQLQAVLDGMERNGEFVFWDHQRRRTSCTRMREFGEILRKAGVVGNGKEKISFQCWRHTFRTRLAAAGVPADVAKRLGGWSPRSDIDATVYNHDMESLKRGIAALP